MKLTGAEEGVGVEVAVQAQGNRVVDPELLYNNRKGILTT